MNPHVDLYLEEGCGRCSLYNTPECKVHRWSQELVQLRRIILECELQEDYKWSQPCYVHDKKNILMLAAFKEYVCIAFFKGVLLADTEGLLIAPGENSQSSRQLRFTSVDEVLSKEAIIRAYIFEAIEVEKAGLKVNFKKTSMDIPEELQEAFEQNPDFKEAFESLTSGRQRGYLLHISSAKQSKTRISRIEKCMPNIFDGKGVDGR